MYKKYIPSLLLLISLLGFFPSYAQNNFVKTGLPPSTIPLIDELEEVRRSSIAFADVDGDSDQDVLITGQDRNGLPIAKLYRNVGSGAFVLVVGTPFDGVYNSAVAFADIDGDNDPDVLITGENSSIGSKSQLYKNDGNGNFSLVQGAPFDVAMSGSIAFADIDGDQDMDVLITGHNSSGPISNLYKNDSTGKFTLVTGTPFEGVYFSSLAFADIDNDNDQDLLITGYKGSYQFMSKLYSNNGSGNFSLIPNTPFDSVYASSVAFADVDGDKDQDVLITGTSSSWPRISKLYINDSSGSFTLLSGTPFDGAADGSVTFADIDGDNDQDVLITGNGSKLYSNDSSGNFTLVTGTSFEGVYYSSVAFADLDGDKDQDLLITGNTQGTFLGDVSSKLYSNDGTGNFKWVSGTPFEGVTNGSVAFADIDSDKDQDVLITGQSFLSPNAYRISVTNLYKNNGFGGYTRVLATTFDSVYSSSVAFADVDGDNDQDVLITGSSKSSFISKLYINDSSGNFTWVPGTPFDSVAYSSIAFADVDGDKDQDVLISGWSSSGQLISKLYINDSSGNYSLSSASTFEGVREGSVAFADVDGDKDKDLLITGLDSSRQPISNLYLNDGYGIFSLDTASHFDGVYNSSIAFADIDGDKDQDVMITGQNYLYQSISKIYSNDSTGNFTWVPGTPFDSVVGSSIAFADVDGDKDQDLLITSWSSSEPISVLYSNDGSGNFTLVLNTPFEGVHSGTINFADIDGDKDQDVLITGENSNKETIAYLYENRNCQTGVPTSSSDTAIACNSYNWLGNSYTSSGTYMDTIPNAAACDSVMSLVLTINESPKSTTQANSCSPYVWRGSTYSTSGIYRDTIPNATGCDSIYILDISVYIIDTTITIGKHSLTSNDLDGKYQWGECKNGFQPIVGDTNQSFTPLYNGDFAVVVSKNNCSDTSACHTVLNVGMQENTFLKSAEIFPNPNNGTFEVSLGQKLNNASIKIINLEGKTIYSKNNQSSSKFNFDISDQAKGIYFLEIVQDKKVFRSRIVYN